MTNPLVPDHKTQSDIKSSAKNDCPLKECPHERAYKIWGSFAIGCKITVGITIVILLGMAVFLA